MVLLQTYIIKEFCLKEQGDISGRSLKSTFSNFTYGHYSIKA